LLPFIFHFLSILLFTAIDIIIGGPPCIDYSGANANRLGVEGRQGSYMVRFGNFIRKLQKLQDRPIYFLAENTVLRNTKNKNLVDGDLSVIEEAFSVTVSITFDAKEVSPCRRQRTYLTNIPFELTGKDTEGSHATLTMCLQEGYMHPAKFR
jgi:site-specific DNA-cytosine methylase